MAQPRERSCHPRHIRIFAVQHLCHVRALCRCRRCRRCLDFWGFLSKIVVSRRRRRQSRKRQIYGGVAMFKTRHRLGFSLIRTFGEASHRMPHRYPRRAPLADFDRRESPLQNDGHTTVSMSAVCAKLNLSTSANVTETREKNSRAQYRNGVDVQSCVPDSPQVLLKPLRIGLCLFTARRPLS